MVKKRYRKFLKLLVEKLKYVKIWDGNYLDLYIEQGENLSLVKTWRLDVRGLVDTYVVFGGRRGYCIKLLMKNGLKRKIERDDFEEKI